MKRIIRTCRYLIEFFTAYIIAELIKLFNPKYCNFWLISERGDDARDNGYYFFKYMMRAHPEQPIWYVIKRNSSDAIKIKETGRFVAYGSFRHFVYFALTNCRISTHAWGGDIPIADYYKKFGLYKLSKKKFVFLQHGITKDLLIGLLYPNFYPDIFICGAQPEFEYICREYKHPQGVVQYTGMARFDNLYIHKEKSQILIMPTFRKWLQGIGKEKFLESDYFEKWNVLLNSPELERILEQANVQLVFYPHYEIQKYVKCFESKISRVVIADFSHYDVQQLLIEAQLLITDFSSVFFDFAYMEKPVIYYQFDRERYISEHYDYTKGYFDYDTMGFGEVVSDKEELLTAIKHVLRQEFVLEDKYKTRIRTFFPLKDDKNCQRIYNAISKIV